MPQMQVALLYAFPQGLVKSQQSVIRWFWFSGTAFAFQ